MCTNNCNQDPCGCKTSTDEVVYKGPNLSCTGINNCDTLTTAIQKINDYMCSIELVQMIFYNIVNNSTLYNQFTTIVNNSVDCQTVWDCIENTTTTTTTATPTTTTTTTLEPTTTTTTTTSAPSYLREFGAGRETGPLACLEVVGAVTLYINTPTISGSSLFYTDPGLTTLFNGAGAWYRDLSGNSSWRIGSSGNPLGAQLC